MAITLDGTNGTTTPDLELATGGSASTPAITVTGDTNTGIFFPAADTIAFAEGGAEVARFDSNGRLLVGLTFANTSGSNFQVSQGITFPATASASSDANTLDDYEEGTWTPVPARLTGGAITSTGAITVQGTYTKIGRLVYVYCDIDIAGTVTQGSSNTIVDGLPFTPARRRNAGSIAEASALTNYPLQSTQYGVVADNAYVSLNFQIANAWKAGALQIVCMYEI